MTRSEVQPLVKNRLRFVLGGAIAIGISVLLIAGGFVEGVLSGCIAAVPGVLGINMLVMGLKRSRAGRHTE